MSRGPGILQLHATLGELLGVLVDVPEASCSHAEWRLSGPTYEERIRWVAFGTPPQRASELLGQVRELLGGGTIAPAETSILNGHGLRVRAHTLRVSFRGVKVAVMAYVPEPTEREALLARLAELDAAEDGGGRP